jgi:hypothetical protein
MDVGAVQIRKKGVPAMSMAKNLTRKTGKKRNQNTDTADVKLKTGELP